MRSAAIISLVAVAACGHSLGPNAFNRSASNDGSFFSDPAENLGGGFVAQFDGGCSVVIYGCIATTSVYDCHSAERFAVSSTTVAAIAEDLRLFRTEVNDATLVAFAARLERDGQDVIRLRLGDEILPAVREIQTYYEACPCRPFYPGSAAARIGREA